jgi:hypothetical protein
MASMLQQISAILPHAGAAGVCFLLLFFLSAILVRIHFMLARTAG